MKCIHRWTVLAVHALFAVGCASAEPQASDEANNAIGSVTEDTETSAVAEQALASYNGCRGTGLSVCDELTDPDYNVNHPNCQRNSTCRLPYYPCDAACPAPTATEKPNAIAKAAGTATPTANLQVFYVRDQRAHEQTLWGYNIPQTFAWERLQRGIGVYATSGVTATVYCDVGSMGITRKVASITTRWSDGKLAPPVNCQGSTACQAFVQVRGGFVATCNFATR